MSWEAMEVSMSKTRRGKYTDNRICYISKCKGDMRLYLRRKGKLPCFSYLVRGKSFSFYRGKIQIKSETRHELSFFPNSFDDYVPKDCKVRMVDRIVRSMDINPLMDIVFYQSYVMQESVKRAVLSYFIVA